MDVEDERLKMLGRTGMNATELMAKIKPIEDVYSKALKDIEHQSIVLGAKAELKFITGVEELIGATKCYAVYFVSSDELKAEIKELEGETPKLEGMTDWLVDNCDEILKLYESLEIE